MMKLVTLGSSSKGNCYLISNDNECLIIELGIRFMKVKKALNFNVSKIVGAIASHCHTDHFKYADDYITAGIPTYFPFMDNETRKCVKYGGFSIQPFKVEHDVPTFGYYIQHKEIGKLLFVTDTSYVKYDFSKLKVNHIMVETNYSDELLADDVKRTHVLVGHMSVNNAYEFVKHNESPQLRNIILIHLSDSNGNREKFLEQFSTFKNCNVYVAEKGLTVDLSECPF